jgi:hypothetical protein
MRRLECKAAQARGVGLRCRSLDNGSAGGVLLLEAAVLDLFLGPVGMDHLDAVAGDLHPVARRRVYVLGAVATIVVARAVVAAATPP